MGDKKLRLWLSREPNGLYLLTYRKPVVARIGHGEQAGMYVAPGDPVGFRHVCPWFVSHIWGIELNPMESRRVMLSGNLLTQKGRPCEER